LLYALIRSIIETPHPSGIAFKVPVPNPYEQSIRNRLLIFDCKTKLKMSPGNFSIAMIAAKNRASNQKKH
jgi:hypothetical protein